MLKLNSLPELDISILIANQNKRKLKKKKL